MARVKAKRLSPADELAGEAWAAGCRDVQAAINWAAGRGVVPGAPFRAAFRKRLAAGDAAPPETTPPETQPQPTPGAGGGRRPRARREAPARPAAEAASIARPAGRLARSKPEANGSTEDLTPKRAPARPAAAASEPKPASPAEFVEDMRTLRQLVNKYGKKGLADLVGMLAG